MPTEATLWPTSLLLPQDARSVKQREHFSFPIDYVKHERRIIAKEHHEELPQRFADVIESSKSLLDLGGDWDGDGAEPVDMQTWTVATTFLRNTLLKSGVAALVPTPNISPCRDGSIDLFWARGGFKLLINVKAASVSDYYGETPTGFVTKGTFDPLQHDLSAALRMLWSNVETK